MYLAFYIHGVLNSGYTSLVNNYSENKILKHTKYLVINSNLKQAVSSDC